MKKAFGADYHGYVLYEDDIISFSSPYFLNVINCVSLDEKKLWK